MAAAGLHLALDLALRHLQSWWSTEAGASLFSMGEGSGQPIQICKISFFITSHFLCH